VMWNFLIISDSPSFVTHLSCLRPSQVIRFDECRQCSQFAKGLPFYKTPRFHPRVVRSIVALLFYIMLAQPTSFLCKNFHSNRAPEHLVVLSFSCARGSLACQSFLPWRKEFEACKYVFLFWAWKHVCCSDGQHTSCKAGQFRKRCFARCP